MLYHFAGGLVLEPDQALLVALRQPLHAWGIGTKITRINWHDITGSRCTRTGIMQQYRRKAHRNGSIIERREDTCRRGHTKSRPLVHINGMVFTMSKKRIAGLIVYRTHTVIYVVKDTNSTVPGRACGVMFPRPRTSPWCR